MLYLYSYIGIMYYKTEKRTATVRLSFSEKVFCYLWGVAKNYIMYWGVTSIIITKNKQKCYQTIFYFCCFFVQITNKPSNEMGFCSIFYALCTVLVFSTVKSRQGNLALFQKVPQIPFSRFSLFLAIMLHIYAIHLYFPR